MKKLVFVSLLLFCLAFPTVAIAGPKDSEVCGVQIKVFNEENRIVAGYWSAGPVSDQMAGESWMEEVLFYLPPERVLYLFEWGPTWSLRVVVVNTNACSGELLLDWKGLDAANPEFIILGDPWSLWST